MGIILRRIFREWYLGVRGINWIELAKDRYR
jgi:hypothetical protein